MAGLLPGPAAWLPLLGLHVWMRLWAAKALPLPALPGILAGVAVSVGLQNYLLA